MTLPRPPCLHRSGGQAPGCWWRLRTASSSNLGLSPLARLPAICSRRNMNFSHSDAYLKDERITERQRKTQFWESLTRRAQLVLSHVVWQPPVLCSAEGAVIKFEHWHLGLFAPLWMDGESCNVCFRKNHKLMISECLLLYRTPSEAHW